MQQTLNSEDGEKFSVLRFSNRRFVLDPIDYQLQKLPERKRSDEQFQRLIEEIRNMLSATGGKTDEEKAQDSELLNKAILGFTAEREKMLAVVNDYITKKRLQDIEPGNKQYNSLAEAVFAEVIGLHVLELILREREGLEEIQVIGKRIYEIRKGQVFLSRYQFESLRDVERIQQNLVLFNHDIFNPRKRWAEVMLSDGSRVTMTGFGYTSEPTLTIRLFTVKHFNLAALCSSEFSTINDEIRELMMVILRSYFNLVVIGPTNSGKTNLIKAFISELPDNERIITIESRFELKLNRDFPCKNIVEYEINEEDPHHSAKQAFKLALRQSPRRICHAEIRDEDANIYVRACTRGHDGSMTTVHANILEDVPDTITEMCMLDGRGMHPERLRKRIAEYVTHIGIEMALCGGKRKVMRIGEFSYHQDEVKVRDLVRFDSCTNCWNFYKPFSRRAAERIRRYDPQGFQEMVSLGWIIP